MAAAEFIERYDGALNRNPFHPTEQVFTPDMVDTAYEYQVRLGEVGLETISRAMVRYEMPHTTPSGRRMTVAANMPLHHRGKPIQPELDALTFVCAGFGEIHPHANMAVRALTIDYMLGRQAGDAENRALVMIPTTGLMHDYPNYSARTKWQMARHGEREEMGDGIVSLVEKLGNPKAVDIYGGSYGGVIAGVAAARLSRETDAQISWTVVDQPNVTRRPFRQLAHAFLTATQGLDVLKANTTEKIAEDINKLASSPRGTAEYFLSLARSGNLATIGPMLHLTADGDIQTVLDNGGSVVFARGKDGVCPVQLENDSDRFRGYHLPQDGHTIVPHGFILSSMLACHAQRLAVTQTIS